MATDAQAERLGRAIMSLRAALGLKRKDLAVTAGLSYPYLAELENGSKTPSARALQSIARALHLTPAELLVRAEALPEVEASGASSGAEEQVQSLPASAPAIAWTEAQAGRDSDDSGDVVHRVVQRVVALVQEDLRKRLEQDLPALVREELERSRGRRS